MIASILKTLWVALERVFSMEIILLMRCFSILKGIKVAFYRRERIREIKI